MAASDLRQSSALGEIPPKPELFLYKNLNEVLNTAKKSKSNYAALLHFQLATFSY